MRSPLCKTAAPSSQGCSKSQLDKMLTACQCAVSASSADLHAHLAIKRHHILRAERCTNDGKTPNVLCIFTADDLDPEHLSNKSSTTGTWPKNAPTMSGLTPPQFWRSGCAPLQTHSMYMAAFDDKVAVGSTGSEWHG